MSKAAKRYARAFFQLASEQQELDAARNDLLSLRRLCSDSDDFHSFIKNPVLPEEQRTSILHALLDGKAHPTTLRFLRFLASKNRLAELEPICDTFEQFYCEQNNLLKVVITSASVLTPEQTDSIRQRLETRFGKTVETEAELDPTLLGGFKVKVGDTIHDYSIQAQLQRFREQLINA